MLGFEVGGACGSLGTRAAVQEIADCRGKKGLGNFGCEKSLGARYINPHHPAPSPLHNRHRAPPQSSATHRVEREGRNGLCDKNTGTQGLDVFGLVMDDLFTPSTAPPSPSSFLVRRCG